MAQPTGGEGSGSIAVEEVCLQGVQVAGPCKAWVPRGFPC